MFFSSPEDYTILHTVLEFTSMAISLMVVSLAWNLRDLERTARSWSWAGSRSAC